MEIKNRIQLLTLFQNGIKPIVIEVGVAEGLFSRDLLEAGAGLLYSVDNWAQQNQRGDGGFPQEWHDKNYENAKKLLEPYGARSIMLKGRSVDMAKKIADKSVHLVYIDADHSKPGVLADSHAFWPKLITGGVMAFHDYESEDYGVKEAVMEFAAEKGLEIHLIPENSKADAGAYFYKRAVKPKSL